MSDTDDALNQARELRVTVNHLIQVVEVQNEIITAMMDGPLRRLLLRRGKFGGQFCIPIAVPLLLQDWDQGPSENVTAADDFEYADFDEVVPGE